MVAEAVSAALHDYLACCIVCSGWRTLGSRRSPLGPSRLLNFQADGWNRPEDGKAGVPGNLDDFSRTAGSGSGRE
jgi:hypothetical protein